MVAGGVAYAEGRGFRLLEEGKSLGFEKGGGGVMDIYTLSHMRFKKCP